MTRPPMSELIEIKLAMRTYGLTGHIRVKDVRSQIGRTWRVRNRYSPLGRTYVLKTDVLAAHAALAIQPS